jgi:hypothetical protein
MISSFSSPDTGPVKFRKVFESLMFHQGQPDKYQKNNCGIETFLFGTITYIRKRQFKKLTVVKCSRLRDSLKLNLVRTV